MNLICLFMQRNESYEGEYGPELLFAIDEETWDEDPTRWRKKIAEAKAAHSEVAAGFCQVKLAVDQDLIRGSCLGERKMEGRIQG